MAAAQTYTPIATTTLGSTQASYTFTSIPSTYTDLVLVMDINDASGSITNLTLTINGDTGTNYSTTRLIGDGTTASSDRQTSQTSGNAGYASTTRGNNIINFMSYANTSVYKTFITRTNNTRVGAFVNLWRSTSAISSIKIENVVSADLVAGSTFTLWGILNA